MNPLEFRPKWLIRSDVDGVPTEQPEVLYKFLDSNFIDSFFNKGELKLGTYESFAHIEDAQRTDAQEGTHEYVVWNKRRDHKWTLRRFTGQHNVIYCTSSSNNTEELQKRFHTSDYFIIENPLGFAYEVAKALDKFVKGLQGPVLYSDSGQTNFYLENYNLPDFDKNTKAPELFETFHIISQINFDLYFSKRSDPYKVEKEFRFVWLLEEPLKQKNLIIKCPGATKYCKRKN